MFTTYDPNDFNSVPEAVQAYRDIYAGFINFGLVSGFIFYLVWLLFSRRIKAYFRLARRS